MPCQPPDTNAEKKWSYEEYYLGEKDEEHRKNGNGLHHWTSAESLEWYTGRLLRDTMHGYGDYRWRYLGPNHTAVTYEGRFYSNRMHGYGLMSYSDGRVYNGLFYNNIRWGPGVESHACLREDVGLWYGTQLVRLAWRPAAPSVAIDLVSGPTGLKVVAPHRVILATNTKTIGEVNSALELLKQYGSEPLAATDKWKKLYPKSCTNTNSQLFEIEVFNRAYYGKQINSLNEVSTVTEESASEDSITDRKTYYAWNNNVMIRHMMKHCYKHEEQRESSGIEIANILAGPRTSFKRAGKHELDCRMLLLASYLGHISNVAQLINECDVNPNVTDMQGNSVLMYAACGDQPDMIHFLIEAGAVVDGYNDNCCTPLGITLLRFTLVRRGVSPSGMLEALLPPPSVPAPLPTDEVLEWHINRTMLQTATNVLQKSPSKMVKPFTSKRGSAKNLTSVNNKKKTEFVVKPEEKNNETDESPSEETLVYNNLNNEYIMKVSELFSLPSEINITPYFFEVRDMNKDVDLSEDELKKVAEKNPKSISTKVFKDTMKPSRETMLQGLDKEDDVLDNKEQMKQEKMSRMMLTILRLLSEGADPCKTRCPQPPLFIATVAGSADLVRHLVAHGADVNEVYPDALGYSTLDLAVSGPLTFDNLSVIRSLLESGAKADHRLPINEPQFPSGRSVADLEPREEDGPTLLHAVLARKVDCEPEEELRLQILELLLEFGCNPITQYKGRSALEVAMSKNMDVFDIFMKSPRTDLNAVINDSNQTILMKMFYLPYCRTIPLTERLQTLTNLLLFGADPLLKCKNGKEEYDNLFVYVKTVISELNAVRKPPSPTGTPMKAKSIAKAKKDGRVSQTKPVGQSKSQGKAAADDFGDYKQALDLVVECARLLYIRWLQAKLMKELIEIVDKYKHRHWNMILREHKNKKCTGLWLTAARCLDIWNILKKTKKKIYNDNKILKHVLCIVHYYYKMTRKILRCPTISSQEKALIELEVASFVDEHNKLDTRSTPDMVPAIRPYVTPELTDKEIEKFNVCFECAIPLADAKIPCGSCKLIAFCSFDCIKTNIDRINCHPCSSYLKEKYFPTPEETEIDVDQI